MNVQVLDVAMGTTTAFCGCKGGASVLCVSRSKPFDRYFSMSKPFDGDLVAEPDRRELSAQPELFTLLRCEVRQPVFVDADGRRGTARRQGALAERRREMLQQIGAAIGERAAAEYRKGLLGGGIEIETRRRR